MELFASTLGNSSSVPLAALPEATSIAWPTDAEPSTSTRGAGVCTSSMMTRNTSPPDAETEAARKARRHRESQPRHRQRIALNIEDPAVDLSTTSVVTAAADTSIATTSNANVPVIAVVPQHRREYEAYRRRQITLQNGNRNR
ncbi:glyoxalase/bleomycin resistance protein/dioxygenase [Anopheles sinensis]|uniref:Glyoxalase/bleomycin resistance protein/dioxygenase n=1 Tax=Anopheles sinensis TaxID=74873 RepID=A0A084VJX7_ANOSI|nr:glyoxalase/bleomycin resistance protein/dioxygenase [Anopheles sinensis]